MNSDKEYKECDEPQEASKLPDPIELHIRCVAWADGACKGNPGPIGLGVVLEIYQDEKLVSVRYSGGAVDYEEGTNNIAEYVALVEVLDLLAAELQPIMMNPSTTTIRPDTLTTVDITINMDSELVVKQMTGEYKVKNENLKRFWVGVQKKLEMMSTCGVKTTIKWIPREENAVADKIAQDALTHLVKE